MNMSRNEFLRRVLAIIEDESVTREDLHVAGPHGCVAMRIFKCSASASSQQLSSIGLWPSRVTEPNDQFVLGDISRREFHDRIAALLVPEEAA